MNIKKIIAIIASTALTATLLASCGSSSSGKTAKKVTKDGKELSVLRVANMTGQPDQYADYTGMEQGIFEKYGISLETSEYAAGINTVDAIATGTADTGLLADFAAVNRIGNTLDNTNLVIFSDLSSSVSYNGGLFVAPKYKDDLDALDESEGWITSIGTVSEYFNWQAQTYLGLDPSKHMIAVTSETSPLAKSDDYLAAFFMDDYIGGRFSSTSAVGGAVLSLAFGPEVFARFLEGAAAEDKLSANEDVLKNPEMLDALIGVYERNVLGYPCTAVLPYSQALNRFPAHLQQLDMESNGKSVNRFGEPVSYPTGPVIFGEPGTNGQHSFYQLLHQGTDIVPLQFVGFKNNQIGTDVVIQDSTSQQKLCANVAAQIVAFACGKSDENRNKNFEGGRPSSIIIGDQVNPGSLGALLAHFENKIMFQGFLWNVNSFDQEGVQLGKVLAKRVLAHETDGALKVFSDLLNI